MTNHNSNTDDDAHSYIQALEAELADTRRQLANTQALGRVIQVTASAANLSHALTLTCDELAHVFNVPQVALAMFEPDRKVMRVVAEYCAPGYTTGMGEIIPVEGNPITEYVIAHQEPMVIPDAQHDERLGPVRDIMRRRGTMSLMIVPVVVADQVVGTLGIDSVDARDFRADEVLLAHDIALALSSAFARASLLEKLQLELADRHRAEEQVSKQALLLAELSSPIIPVTAQTLVLPLIGAVDAQRANLVLEQLVAGVVDYQAERVIIDITGLPVIDTYVADMLVRTARAIKLLGSEAILTGIRAEVAQTIISIGIDLGSIRTFSTLQQAIAVTLNEERY